MSLTTIFFGRGRRVVLSWLSVSSKVKWGIWEVFVLSVIDIHNEIISTRNLLWCTLLDVFWENNLVLIKSICCFDIWSWKFSAPLRVYSAFCTSEWEILKLTFPLENDSSDVSEKNWIREQHKSQDFFMLQSDFYDNYWWTLSLWHQLSILLSRLNSQFSLLAALYFLVNVWQEFGLWSR